MKTFVRLAMIASAGALFLAGIGCGGGEEEGRDVAGEDAGTGDVETAPDQSVAPDETPESDVQVAPDETPEPDVQVLPDETPEPDAQVAPDETPEPDVQVAPDESPEPDVQVAPDESPEPDVKTCADQVCGKNAECDESVGECVCLDGFVMLENGDCEPAQPPLLADLEDLTVPAEGFWNGSDASGGFESGELKFLNDYNADWAAWNGFSYSNMADTTTPGFGNQYSAITGKGAEESKVYAVAYDASGMGSPAPAIAFAGAGAGFAPAGVFVTNSTYAYLAMTAGDDFSKKFGGVDGTDPDWFLLTIAGQDGQGKETGKVEFYLADFRDDDAGKDYVIGDWTWVDLTSLGTVTELSFTLSSSDVGDFGMNTPAYLALDQVRGAIVE